MERSFAATAEDAAGCSSESAVEDSVSQSEDGSVTEEGRWIVPQSEEGRWVVPHSEEGRWVVAHSEEGRWAVPHSEEGRWAVPHSEEGRWVVAHSVEGRWAAVRSVEGRLAPAVAEGTAADGAYSPPEVLPGMVLGSDCRSYLNSREGTRNSRRAPVAIISPCRRL